MMDSPGSRNWLLWAMGGALAVLFGLQVYALRARPAPAASAPKPAADPAAPSPLVAALRARAASNALAAPAPAAPAYGPRREAAPAPSGAAAREIERLTADNTALRARLDDMLGWIVDNLQGRFPLEEEQMAHLRIPPVDSEGFVTGDLARLLRLTDDETGRLDDAFVGSRDVLYDLESAGITVTVDSAASDAPDGTAPVSVTLNFAPYPEDGALVRDALYEELLATLGRARFARLLQVSGTGLAESFDYFGDRQRTLTVDAELLPAGEEGAPLFVIRDETAVQDPDNPDRVLIRASEAVAESLPPEYDRYAPYFPGTFFAAASPDASSDAP